MFLGSKGLNQHCVLGAPGTVLLEETFTAETKPWARQAAAVSFAPGASRPAVQGPQNSPDQHPVGGAFSGGLNTRRGQAGLAASREAGVALGRRPLLRGGGRGGPRDADQEAVVPPAPPPPNPPPMSGFPGREPDPVPLCRGQALRSTPSGLGAGAAAKSRVLASSQTLSGAASLAVQPARLWYFCTHFAPLCHL